MGSKKKSRGKKRHVSTIFPFSTPALRSIEQPQIINPMEDGNSYATRSTIRKDASKKANSISMFEIEKKLAAEGGRLTEAHLLLVQAEQLAEWLDAVCKRSKGKSWKSEANIVSLKNQAVNIWPKLHPQPLITLPENPVRELHEL